MVVVKKKPGEDTGKLISRFRRAASKVVDEYRKKHRYEKPSAKKREKKKRLAYIDQLKREGKLKDHS